MNLTTLARVKIQLEFGGMVLNSGTTHPTNKLLNSAITLWSEKASTHLNRLVPTATYTQQFDVERNQTIFHLKAYPVSAISEIRYDSAREFTGATVSSANYTALTATGEIFFDSYPMTAGRRVLRVIYRGGMATANSGSAFATAFPEIAGAMDLQVAYHYDRRKAVGRSTTTDGRANVTFSQNAIDWLPTVMEVLNRHRKRPYGR